MIRGGREAEKGVGRGVGAAQVPLASSPVGPGGFNACLRHICDGRQGGGQGLWRTRPKPLKTSRMSSAVALVGRPSTKSFRVSAGWGLGWWVGFGFGLWVVAVVRVAYSVCGGARVQRHVGRGGAVERGAQGRQQPGQRVTRGGCHSSPATCCLGLLRLPKHCPAGGSPMSQPIGGCSIDTRCGPERMSSSRLQATGGSNHADEKPDNVGANSGQRAAPGRQAPPGLALF